jgi:hypothetical protein
MPPRTPGLIWVRDLMVGDVMVDGSVRVGRLRPLGLRWVTALRREPSSLREQAARVCAIGAGLADGIASGCIAQSLAGSGARAAGPSSRRVWKQRRASLREIVRDALVCESPRFLSSR